MATDWGTRGAPAGGVSGAKRGRVPARFRSFPWCFKVMRPWLSQGKNTLPGGRGGLKCTARRGGGAIHINLENAVSVYWSERDKGTVIAFIGGEKDAVLVEERPEQILSG